MLAALETARDALAGIAGIVSCKIGSEPNISPNDYPLIRLVPVRILPGRPYHGRSAEVNIIFGVDTTRSEGLELVYQEMFALEDKILTVLKTLGGRYLETLTDNDSLPTYKMMAIRCELQTVNAAPPPPPAPAPAPAP